MAVSSVDRHLPALDNLRHAHVVARSICQAHGQQGRIPMCGQIAITT